MLNQIKAAWEDYVQPMIQRPKRLQVAALCYRTSKSGKQVLLVTSRDTGRWIIPKGWPIAGMTTRDAAAQEAWEEAGVLDGDPEAEAIGSYSYDKVLDNGLPVPVETLVFPIEVRELADEFPEADERERRWVSPEDAANLVNEPELKSILRDI